MDRSKVAIVIPAFNEETTIAAVVGTALQFGQPIVVNDCSSDRTAQVASAHGAIVVNHDVNQGYDAALNSGFREAARLQFDFIVTLDADGQHDLELLAVFISKLEGGASLVLGVRSSKYRLAEYIFAWYTKVRYGVRDPLCGMKAYHRRVYDAVGHFDSFRSIGTELMLRAISSGEGFEQVCFHVRDRLDASRFGSVIPANLRIFRALWIWLWK